MSDEQQRGLEAAGELGPLTRIVLLLMRRRQVPIAEIGGLARQVGSWTPFVKAQTRLNVRDRDLRDTLAVELNNWLPWDEEKLSELGLPVGRAEREIWGALLLGEGLEAALRRLRSEWSWHAPALSWDPPKVRERLHREAGLIAGAVLNANSSEASPPSPLVSADDMEALATWIAGIGTALLAPAPWQPTWSSDIDRGQRSPLGEHRVTIIRGAMGAGKTRFVRRSLADRINKPNIDPRRERLVVPILLEARHLPEAFKAGSDVWRATIASFVADFSPLLHEVENQGLTDLVYRVVADGSADVVLALDGLDEAPRELLLQIFDPAVGKLARMLTAGNVRLVLAVRSGTDAEALVTAFGSNVQTQTTHIQLGRLSFDEATDIAEAWGISVAPASLSRLLQQHPSALMFSMALSTGLTAASDTELLAAVVARLLAGEWKPTRGRATPRDLDRALRTAAQLAYEMAVDTQGWLHQARVHWARGRIVELGDDNSVALVARLLPQLEQIHASECSWVHASLQEYLTGWHIANGLKPEAGVEALRSRWVFSGGWRRVAAHAIASARDPRTILQQLEVDADTDPTGLLDQLLIGSATDRAEWSPGARAALGRIQNRIKARGIGSSTSGNADIYDGLAGVPALLARVGPEAFDPFGPDDYGDFSAGGDGQPIWRSSRLWGWALSVNAPVAMEILRRGGGLSGRAMRQAVMSEDRFDYVSAGFRHLTKRELATLNDPAHETGWPTHDVPFLACQELWRRGLDGSVPNLPHERECNLARLVENLGSAAVVALLQSTHRGDLPSYGIHQGVGYSSRVVLARAGPQVLVQLLKEPTASPMLKLSIATAISRAGGENPAKWLVEADLIDAWPCVQDCETCRPGVDISHALDLLDALIDDPNFPVAESLIARTASRFAAVQAIQILHEHGRVTSLRRLLDFHLASAPDYSICHARLLELDLGLSESERLGILLRTDGSGDPESERDRSSIYYGLKNLSRDARRSLWRQVAPNGFARRYNWAGLILEDKMLHEVLDVSELCDAAMDLSTRSSSVALAYLQRVILVDKNAARALASNIAAKRWPEHRSSCKNHLQCTEFSGMAGWFPIGVREAIEIHGDGLRLISGGRYELIEEWPERETNLFIEASGGPNAPLAKAVALAAAHDRIALGILERRAETDPAFARVLDDLDPAAHRDRLESQIRLGELVPDDRVADTLIKLGSPVGVSWYIDAISAGHTRPQRGLIKVSWLEGPIRTIPSLDSHPELVRIAIRGLVDALVSATTSTARVGLADALLQLWPVDENVHSPTEMRMLRGLIEDRAQVIRSATLIQRS